MGSNWKDTWETLKKKYTTMDTKQKKSRLLILLLCGLLLLVVAIPVPKTGEKGVSEKSMATASAGDYGSTGESLTDYEAYLEEKTAQTLEKVEGAGAVTVMITLKSTGQKVVEKDQQSSSQTTKETDSQGGTRDSEEKSSEKTTVYSQETDGTQIPYVSKENAPEVAGVVVIAQGGDNAVVVKNLTEAVQALFGVEPHKIKIMKRSAT